MAYPDDCGNWEKRHIPFYKVHSNMRTTAMAVAVERHRVSWYESQLVGWLDRIGNVQNVPWQKHGNTTAKTRVTDRMNWRSKQGNNWKRVPVEEEGPIEIKARSMHP